MQIAFLVIFGLGLALAVLAFVLGELFDLGDSGDSGGAVGESTPSPLSSRVLFVFATAFGGFGFIGTALGMPVWGSSLMAIVGGLAVAGGTFFLIVLPMARQQGSTDVHREDLDGLYGNVTSEIPEGGLGRVTVIAPTSKARVALAARSHNGARIPFGTAVVVNSAGPGVAVVTPVAPGSQSTEERA